MILTHLSGRINKEWMNYRAVGAESNLLGGGLWTVDHNRGQNSGNHLENYRSSPAQDPVACDFGDSETVKTWIANALANIDACQLSRRRPRLAETVHVQLRDDDPLRHEVAGSFGAYAVRVMWNALGFDEHRKFTWRLEHKLVQALVFNHYTGGAFPRTWGINTILRTGQRDSLLDALLAGRLFTKETLGHLSGDSGQADATPRLLEILRGYDELPAAGSPVEESWIVQERFSIEREYRVHSLENQVLAGMTFDRYRACSLPEDRCEVNAYVASILAQLPDALVGESLYAWDIARLTNGCFRVIETNLVGFHPYFQRGFQASGFFQYHPMGPALLAELGQHISTTYNVALEAPDSWRNEPNRQGLFLRIFRHYLHRRPSTQTPPAASRHPDRLDAVLNVRAEEFERFALLRESIQRTGAPIGTLWVATPDDDLAVVAKLQASASPRCLVIPESELIPELSDLPETPASVRRQVARLALVARTEGAFCFDLNADVVSVGRFRISDLIQNDRVYYSRHINAAHEECYEQAEDLLGLRRSGWMHGSSPYLWSKRAVAELIDFLNSRSADSPASKGSWRRFLLGRHRWSLAQVYFTFLEAFGLEERDYFPGEENLYENCLWSSEDWENWNPAACFDKNGTFYFTVVQVGREVSADAVRRRLAPYLGLKG